MKKFTLMFFREIRWLTKKIKTIELDLKDHYLLQEGNCFRNQVINNCTKNLDYSVKEKIRYERLFIDSLMKIVDSSRGITIIFDFAKKHISHEK